MTKTIMILAIATAFVVGTIATGALVDAAKPETDPDEDLTMEGIVFEIIGLLKHPVFGLEEIKNEVRDIEISVADISDIKTEVSNIEGKLDGTTTSFISDIKTEVSNIEGKLDGTTSSFVSDIKTETDKIQMVKDNQYVPFIKTSTTLGNCASAGASQVNKFVNIDASGEVGDFIITGLLITVGGVNAGATMSIGQITIDQLQYTFQSADLISGFSGTPSAEVLGSPTTQGRTMPHQFAADSSGSQDIRFNLFCTATVNADLVVEQLTVSGWKKPGHIITII